MLSIARGKGCPSVPVDGDEETVAKAAMQILNCAGC